MDPQSHARLAQKMLVGGDALTDDAIDVVTYRARPDFAQIEEINRNYVPGQPPPTQAPQSWLAFVFSKPSFTGERVQVHVLDALTETGEVRERWIKLKRREAVEQALGVTLGPRGSSAADINRVLLAGVLEDNATGPSVELAQDQRLDQGPAWLAAEPVVQEADGSLSIQCPYMDSPLDAPARFAGMHYLKVMAPEWAQQLRERQCRLAAESP